MDLRFWSRELKEEFFKVYVRRYRKKIELEFTLTQNRVILGDYFFSYSKDHVFLMDIGMDCQTM